MSVAPPAAPRRVAAAALGALTRLAGRCPVGRRLAPGALLALIVVFFVGWDLWAVLVDRRLAGSDAYTYHTIQLAQHVAEGSFSVWLAGLGYKGPLAPLLSLPWVVVLAQIPLATRMVSVLAHGVLTWQSYHLARRLDLGAGAALWAAFIVGSSPLIFGWARMDFHEPLLAVLVMAVLQVLVALPMDRARHALLLGLLLGLGLLTKLAFLAFMVAPGVWLLARRVRDARSAGRIVLALAAMLGVAGAWLVPNARTIYYNLLMSTSGREGAVDKLFGYVGEPEPAVMLAGAAVGAVVLWRTRPDQRWATALLAAFVAVSLAQFCLVFDFWTRYIVPLFPVSAVLLAAALVWAGRRLPRWLAAPVGVGLIAFMLHYYYELNAHVVQGDDPRDFVAGMLSPDRRAYTGVPRTIRALTEFPSNNANRAEARDRPDPRVCLLIDAGSNPNRLEGLFLTWRFRGLRFDNLGFDEAQRLHRAGQDVSVLLIRGPSDHELSWFEKDPTCPPLRSSTSPPEAWSDGRRWLAQSRRRCVLTVVDPDGMAYVAYRVLGRRSP